MHYNININRKNVMILLSMSASLFILPLYTNILPWKDIPLINIIRSILWILYIPFSGVHLTTIINTKFSGLEKIVYGYHISIIILSIITLIIYRLFDTIIYVPYAYLLFTIPVILYKNKLDIDFNRNIYPQLLILVIVNLIICLSIQYCQKYLIPTDLWVAANPAIEMFKKSDFLNNYKDLSAYPILFGIFLAGITSCTGIPVINTFVLLFFYGAFNIITFFMLINKFLNFSKFESLIITIIYGFSGGIGWILQNFIWNSNYSLNIIRRYTNDIFFDMGWWNTMEYSHRALALTFTFISIMFLYLFKNTYNYSYLFLCSTSMIFVFYIHMIELIIIIPVILYLMYPHFIKDFKILINFSVLLILTFLLIDFLTDNYLTWLIFEKITLFNITFKYFNYIIYIAITLSTLYIINKYIGIKNFIISDKYKNIIITIILIIYIMGDIHRSNPLELYDSFSWNLYLKRYGFIGIFSIFGLLLIDWKDDLFKFIIGMGIGPLIIGSLWWGSRINSYMYPALIILCGVSVIHIFYKTREFKIEMQFNKDTKKIPLIFYLIFTIIIGVVSSTFIYSSYFYSTNTESISDNYADALNWLYKNTNQKDVILVPDQNKIIKSIIKIASVNITYYEERDDIDYNNKNEYIILKKELGLNYIFTATNNETLITTRIKPFPDFYYKNTTIAYKKGGVCIYYIN